MMKKFIVASASPRRRELLMNAGYEFEIIPSDADETLPGNTGTEQAVCLLAERKALSVLAVRDDAVVLGCDTVVVLDDEILGKPTDREDAKRMLRLLSDRAHKVITAVCIAEKGRKETFCNVTEVEFYPLSEKTVESYVSTGECDDKAGSYGIQGYGAALVSGIKGDYFSVMGLPVAQCVRVLSEFGIEGSVKV
ncbi:MAG: septum formation inhibitor Maf [Clostridia bacterium]|nr:septum formation inhibitor Maf [Clostridia bacterium]